MSGRRKFGWMNGDKKVATNPRRMTVEAVLQCAEDMVIDGEW